MWGKNIFNDKSQQLADNIREPTLVWQAEEGSLTVLDQEDIQALDKIYGIKNVGFLATSRTSTSFYFPY